MPRAARGYRCAACGWTTAAYAGRCSQCQAWNTLEPFAEPRGPAALRGASAPIPARTLALNDVPDEAGLRLPTRIDELDRVLGGGLAPGSLVLIGGDPGIGKSTLVLQAAARLAAQGKSVAYVCGEESPRQVRMRATRLGVADAGITLIPETNLDACLATAAAAGVDVLIIDSIQSVYVERLETRSGGPAQLSEAGARLVTFAKGNEIATIVTGHVTKGGEIAGPRLLEHLVDAVLYFETAEGGSVRVLRAVKNRFGATDEVGVFEMTGEGLQSVENPSSALLESHDDAASGCAVTAVIEGSRPLALEVQALAVPTNLASPRRIASGLETSRLHLLLAMLPQRHDALVRQLQRPPRPGRLRVTTPTHRPPHLHRRRIAIQVQMLPRQRPQLLGATPCQQRQDYVVVHPIRGGLRQHGVQVLGRDRIRRPASLCRTEPQPARPSFAPPDPAPSQGVPHDSDKPGFAAASPCPDSTRAPQARRRPHTWSDSQLASTEFRNDVPLARDLVLRHR